MPTRPNYRPALFFCSAPSEATGNILPAIHAAPGRLAARAVRDPCADRRRRDGRGLARPRHEARARGRAQGPDAAVATDPDRLARFRREAQLLAALNHPNIAAIHGLEEADGAPFLVLERVEGEDLAARLKRGPLPLDEALALARQIAEALEEAHEHGIVHRDLKPANVKLTPDGKSRCSTSAWPRRWSGELRRARLVLATYRSRRRSRARTAGRRHPRHRRLHVARAGARARRSTSARTCGPSACSLYEMLTGRRLFDGETVSDVLAAVLTRAARVAALPAARRRA